MIEKKIVTLEDGVIINIGRLEFPTDDEGNEIIPSNIAFEELEMKYSDEHGWRTLDWQPPVTDAERIAQLEEQNASLTETLDLILSDVIPTLLGGGE